VEGVGDPLTNFLGVAILILSKMQSWNQELRSTASISLQCLQWSLQAKQFNVDEADKQQQPPAQAEERPAREPDELGPELPNHPAQGTPDTPACNTAIVGPSSCSIMYLLSNLIADGGIARSDTRSNHPPSPNSRRFQIILLA
jgi:hypothetical protein